MAKANARTCDERLVSDAVVRAMREGVESCGEALLLVPTLPEAIRAQKALAERAHLTLGCDVTTPTIWSRALWEVWGDGRSIADGSVLTVLAYEVIREAPPEVAGPVTELPGMVSVVARLVGRASPWLPMTAAGELDEGRCAACGLTQAETAACRLALRLASRLGEHGYVSAAEAMALMPELMDGATLPHVVVAGFCEMSRAERELVRALDARGRITFVTGTLEGPAAALQRRLVEDLGLEAGPLEGLPGASVGRTPALAALVDRLFSSAGEPLGHAGVRMLHAAGPVAEAELVATCLAGLVGEDPGVRVLVAVPDARRAWRDLMPKLEERGVSARISWRRPLLDNEHAQAFLGFAGSVARLKDLADAWPEPVMGRDGEMGVLGDMSWWPPREIVDFLFEDMAHMEPERVWRLDAQWRGNRLLTPERVLTMLQQERVTSQAVAQATFELLRGRLGAAASKLIAPYGWVDTGQTDPVGNESRSVLQGMLKLSGTLRSLGVSYDAADPEGRTVAEIVGIWEQAAEGLQLTYRAGAGPSKLHPQVEVMGLDDAARVEPASFDVVLVCGLTSQEQPVKARDGVFEALLRELDIERAADPLARARAGFRSLLGAARSQVILERCLKDAEGVECYPSVMLAELLEALGCKEEALAGPARSERLLSENLSRDGSERAATCVSEPALAGRVSDGARGLIFVPQPGRLPSADGLPVLSASQIEAYLDCPYKWFSKNRLGLGGVDACHGPSEMGSFAHRVLEVTHTELLARALERERAAAGEPMPEGGRAALLAELAADPCRHVEGSRVSEENLEEARAVLADAFELHREHMYLERSPNPRKQLLVAHDSNELAQEHKLKDDLLSTLVYETKILKTFEPRFFEWRFGGKGALVKYAGAYIVGTADRIDVSPHGGAIIVDYKHKSAHGLPAEYDALADGVLDGTVLPRRVQSLIYAQVVRRAFEGRLRVQGSFYLSTRSPHALAGVADENVLDLVFDRLSANREPRVSVPATSPGVSGMHALLDQTEELIAAQVRRMLAGDIEARPRDRHSCEYCPVMQCERRVER